MTDITTTLMPDTVNFAQNTCVFGDVCEHDTVGLEDILKKKTIIKCHKSRNILELWHLMYIIVHGGDDKCI